jgi:hypothetical protein
LNLEVLAKDRTRNPEADIVVAVVWVVVVAVRRAEVLWIVVPGAAAKDTTGRSRQPPQAGKLHKNPASIRSCVPPRVDGVHKNFAARLRRVSAGCGP